LYATRSTQPVHDLTGFASLAEAALMFGSLHETKGQSMFKKLDQIIPKVVPLEKEKTKDVGREVLTFEEFSKWLKKHNQKDDHRRKVRYEHIR